MEYEFPPKTCHNVLMESPLPTTEGVFAGLQPKYGQSGFCGQSGPGSRFFFAEISFSRSLGQLLCVGGDSDPRRGSAREKWLEGAPPGSLPRALYHVMIRSTSK
jgi:hypothetical protein